MTKDMPVTEDEAEAVLLALGPQLEWKPFGDSCTKALVDSGEYTVLRYVTEQYTALPLIFCLRFRTLRPLFYRYTASYRREGTKTSDYYFCRRRENAQAACEYHYATGNWGKFRTTTDPLIK